MVQGKLPTCKSLVVFKTILFNISFVRNLVKYCNNVSGVSGIGQYSPVNDAGCLVGWVSINMWCEITS